jgi:tRNA pseudouridine38-40 synthase
MLRAITARSAFWTPGLHTVVIVMPRIALGIEYDGTRFVGWQIQKNGPSVQSELELALSRVANEPVRVICAGRTDTGVHATGQVVHMDTGAMRKPHSWVRGANTYLGDDVNVLWATEVPDDFHARFSATSRSYRYLMLNRKYRSALWCNRTAWVYDPLDENAMHRAAQALVGKHDFSSFRASGCQAHSPVRTVSHISVTRHGEILELQISANAFLHHMVRNIAGSLIKIGSGLAPENWLGEVLGMRDRTKAGVTGLPQGLYLTNVGYPPEFKLPPCSKNNASDCFMINGSPRHTG